MGWPYDVVIQRGTCRFRLKITAGPDQNSSSISVVLFLLDASLLEEGGMAGWGCIVLFLIPLSLSKRMGKGSERGSSWNLLSHLCRWPTVVSFTASEFSSRFPPVRPSFRKSAVWFKSGATACLARRYARSSNNCVVLDDWKQARYRSSQPGERGLASQPISAIRLLHVEGVRRQIHWITLWSFMCCADGDRLPWIFKTWIYNLGSLPPTSTGTRTQTAHVRVLCLVWVASQNHSYNNFLKFFLSSSWNTDEATCLKK